MDQISSTMKDDLSEIPPFKMVEIRSAIPKHCWIKSSWRSLSYVVKDMLVILGLALAAIRLNSWAIWPVYWAVQGTMFWAIFVLGHECGHGSFSDYPTLNSIVGHILHSPILVPYNGWRISHRKHHNNHGHVENDESWTPMPETLYKEMGDVARFFRFSLPFPLLAFPIYLWRRSPGKYGSHFHPKSDLFDPSEGFGVIISSLCCYLVAGMLFSAPFLVGPGWVLKVYGVPYLIFVFWLDFVTYMHHHGSDDKLPWYRGKEWSYMRGALTTTDQDYGLFNKIHHDIGTHVIHHLFPQIPHYHLVEATKAAKPVLGKYYREPVKAMVLPFHLLGILSRSLRRDHYVDDGGDVVFYKTYIDRKNI